MNPPSTRISATNTKNLRSNPPKTWFECLRKMPWIQVWKIGPKCLKVCIQDHFFGIKRSIEVPMVETRWNKYISLGGIPHLTICSFLWRAQYKPHFPLWVGRGYPQYISNTSSKLDYSSANIWMVWIACRVFDKRHFNNSACRKPWKKALLLAYDLKLRCSLGRHNPKKTHVGLGSPTWKKRNEYFSR